MKSEYWLSCRSLGEDDILIDPSELLGKRLDFQLVLDQCCGLRWVKEARNRGVQIGLVLCKSLGTYCVSLLCKKSAEFQKSLEFFYID